MLRASVHFKLSISSLRRCTSALASLLSSNAGSGSWPDGNIDILIKVQDGTFIQSTNESATAVDGAVWIFSRDYGSSYDHFFTDLSVGGQSIIALSTINDVNNNTASGTVSA